MTVNLILHDLRSLPSSFVIAHSLYVFVYLMPLESYFHSMNCCYAPLVSSLQVTETRTGPLGCSNYDNLDSVSSVLVQSPENKIHLQGWPSIIELPQFLMELSQCLFSGRPITATQECQNEFSFNHSFAFFFFLFQPCIACRLLK